MTGFATTPLVTIIMICKS